MSGRRSVAAALSAAACLLAACEDASVPLVIGRPGVNPGEFDRPRGVAAAAGRVAVLDMTGRLQRFTAEGALEAAFPVMPEGSVRGFPLGLVLLPDLSSTVVHTHESALVRFSAGGREISRFGSNGVREGEFCMPQRALLSARGYVVSDFGYPECRRVYRFDARGRHLGTVGGPGTTAVFDRPMGVAETAGGPRGTTVLWVADASHRIFRFAGNALLDTVGTHGAGPGHLSFPTGIAALPGGGVVVCEAGNHRLQRFASDGTPAGTFGRQGSLPGEFRGPYDLAVDGPWLFVADTDNHRVQRLRIDSIPWESAAGAAR